MENENEGVRVSSSDIVALVKTKPSSIHMS